MAFDATPKFWGFILPWFLMIKKFGEERVGVGKIETYDSSNNWSI